MKRQHLTNRLTEKAALSLAVYASLGQLLALGAFFRPHLLRHGPYGILLLRAVVPLLFLVVLLLSRAG